MSVQYALLSISALLVFTITVTMTTLSTTGSTTWSTSLPAIPSLVRQSVDCDDDRPTTPGLETARHGGVASENKICSNIGIQLLRRGGNAADALVGTTFCTGVIGMYHSGIGGGGFALVRTPEGSYEYVDFRETAPAASYRDMFSGDINASVTGGLSVGVPGEVRGMAHLHQKYGKLPWEDVLQGAINVARYGWTVNEDLVRYMNYTLQQAPRNFLVEDPDWFIDFAPNGTLIGVGDTITRKRYADTLEAIAKKGPDTFYTGAMAEAMVKAVKDANGTLTMDDLRQYTIEIRNTSQIDYRGYKVTSCSAPASGAVALSALKILEGFDDIGSVHQHNISTHRLSEAFRFAYAQRTALGDPAFAPNTSHVEDLMLLPSTASHIRTQISDSHTLNISSYNPSGLESESYYMPSDHGTSHVVTADNSGLAISMTTTINLLFGAQIIVPSTGVILNDEMNDFSIPGVRNAFGVPPSPSNYIAPGKRPFSSITPVIVEDADGRLVLITGAAGGSRIITATVQVVSNVLDRGMGIEDALRAPRLHDQLIPNVAGMEDGFEAGIVEFMRERGHDVLVPGAAGSSSAQGIAVLPDGSFEAAGEPRQRDSAGLTV